MCVVVLWPQSLYLSIICQVGRIWMSTGRKNGLMWTHTVNRYTTTTAPTTARTQPDTQTSSTLRPQTTGRGRQQPAGTRKENFESQQTAQPSSRRYLPLLLSILKMMLLIFTLEYFIVKCAKLTCSPTRSSFFCFLIFRRTGKNKVFFSSHTSTYQIRVVCQVGSSIDGTLQSMYVPGTVLIWPKNATPPPVITKRTTSEYTGMPGTMFITGVQ